jgi:hypothetical protein
MSVQKLRMALTILRTQDMEKEAGIGSTIKNVAKAVKGGATHGAEMLRAKGHKNLALALQYAPEALAAGAAYKAYQSPTGQKLRYKYQLWKARRQQQRGY